MPFSYRFPFLFSVLALQDRLDAALYAALNTQTVLATATGGVYNTRARPGAPLPYVVFRLIAGEDSYSFDGEYEDVRYLVEGIAKGPWPKGASDLDTVIDTALEDATLSLTGFSHLLCRRERDAYRIEDVGGVRYQHSGGVYRIMADRS